MNISALFINRPVMTTLIYVAIAAFGIWGYRTMPVSDLPNVDYPVITVNAAYPGADPAIMAANIATPLEQEFLTIQGIDTITSNNSLGFTNIVLQFKLGKSVDAAATDVQAAITRATSQLPTDLPSPPVFTKTNPNDHPILFLGFGSASMTEEDMYDYIYTEVAQRMNIVSGVSQVQVYGSRRSVRVDVDPSRLALMGMSVSDVANAVGSNTNMISAGRVKGQATSFTLLPQMQLETVEQYENMVVASHDGAPVYLRDVAKVYTAPESADFKLNFGGADIPEGMGFVMLAISKADGANAVQISEDIRALLPSIEKQLPQSILMYLIYDRSETILASVNDVMETMIIAFILVVLIIFLFLGRVTDTVIPAVALPMSLLMTFIVMRTLGYSIDNLSLLGLTLAIGFLVDDAIVFLENVVRRMQDFGEDVATACYNGAKEISFTILAMTLSLGAVFIPLVFMSGIMGLVFRELGVTIIVAVLSSGFVSLTLTPMMCSRMLKPRGKENETFVEKKALQVENWFLGLYGPSLNWALKHWYVSVAAYLLFSVLMVWLAVMLPKTFLPVGDSGFSFGAFVAPTGTSPDRMKAYQEKVNAVLAQDKNLSFHGVITGVGAYFPPNQGIVIAKFKDRKERDPIAPASANIAGQISSIPGIICVLNPQPTLQISTGATSKTLGDYSYSLSGLEAEEVYPAAQKLMMAMAQNNAVFSSVNSDLYMDSPTLNLNFDREAGALYGINAQEFAMLLKNAYSENYTYLIKAPLQQYQVIIEVDRSLARIPEHLDLLYLGSQLNKGGSYSADMGVGDDSMTLGAVPYAAVSTTERTITAQTVNHLNKFNAVNLFFNLAPGVAIGDAMAQVEQLSAQIVPDGVMTSFQGEAMTFRQTMADLFVMFIVAVFVMYVILGILYESYLHPLTVLLSLIPALAGGMGALYLTGSELSLYSVIGLFMLAGIVKKNAIMMIDFAVMHQASGMETKEAVHRASMERFRPIIMTTMAAFFGVIPIALGWGADAETRQPLGFVVAGGLILAQILTLYVTPVTYMGLEWLQEHVLDKIPLFARGRIGSSLQSAADTKTEPAQNA